MSRLIEPFAEYLAPGATPSFRSLQMSDGVRVAVQIATPGGAVCGDVLVVAGLGGQTCDWKAQLRSWSAAVRVSWLPSREKATTHYHTAPSAAMLTLSRLAADLYEVVEQLGLVDGGYDLVVASINANALLEAWPRLTRRPARLLLVTPNLRFAIGPLARLALRRVPRRRWAESLALCLAGAWLTRHGGAAAERQRVHRCLRALDLRLVRPLLLSLSGYRFPYDVLGEIAVPVTVVGAADDYVHPEARLVAEAGEWPYLELRQYPDRGGAIAACLDWSAVPQPVPAAATAALPVEATPAPAPLPAAAGHLHQQRMLGHHGTGRRGASLPAAGPLSADDHPREEKGDAAMGAGTAHGTTRAG